MKTAIRLLILLTVLASMTGCASSGYLADRGRDALDVVTATVGGVGAGAKARVGPLHAGLFLSAVDMAGIRGGNGPVFHKFSERGDLVSASFECDLTPLYYLEYFEEDKHARNKNYRAGCMIPLTKYGMWGPGVPFLGAVYDGGGSRIEKQFHPYYTQVEVAIGLGATFRLGVNFGELADFLLGWVGVDIFSDD